MINQRDPIPTRVQSNGILTGAAYIRVSTDGQMDLSPESQLDEILKYAETHGIRLDVYKRQG